MALIGQTSTPLLAASSTTWRHLAGTIPSAVAAVAQLSGTAQPAHLSMQQWLYGVGFKSTDHRFLQIPVPVGQIPAVQALRQ